MELTQNEQKVKDFMFNKFIPALHRLVSTSDPIKYQTWNGNTCRQSAVFGLVYLRKLLPEYEWTAWDGDFSDIYRGKRVEYNHAWIHGVDKKNNKGLLVDLSRVDRERLFLPVKANKYPKNHPEYKSMKLIRKKKINIEDRLNEEEFYTNLKGDEFIKKLNLDVIEV
ncbi:hypothetical protein [Bacillus mojavensis]